MLSRAQADFSLYLVTDEDLCLGRDLIDVILKAVKGGVTTVQLREKNKDTRAFVELALSVVEALKPFDVPLLINDRVDVMAAVRAQGVHVGQSDMHPNDVRALLGMDSIVGLSVNNFNQIYEAEKLDVDYVALSPVFPTSTKKDLGQAFGIQGIVRARFASSRSIVAIGGINALNAEEVYKAGADGIAVVSAICSAQDPFQAAAELASKKPRRLHFDSSFQFPDIIDERKPKIQISDSSTSLN